MLKAFRFVLTSLALTFLTYSEVPAHGAVLSDLESLHLAVLDLHGAAVIINVAAMETGPSLTGALQCLKLHHRLTTDRG